VPGPGSLSNPLDGAKGFRRSAFLVLAAAAWALAAYFLWRSQVPDLSLPDLDPHAFFGSSTLSRAEDFERFLEWSWVGEQVLLLGVFAAYAVWGAAFMKSSAAGRVGTGIFLAMMGFALAWFVRVPFQILDTWWERRHGVLKTGYVEVVLGGWLALGVTFLALSVGVAIVMALAGWLGQLWWIAAVPVFVAIAILLTFVSPYLETNTHPLRNPTLAAAAKRIEKQEGLSGIEVEVQDVHDYTPTENAYAIGLGPTRKVFLWDTLLTGGLTERQLETVLAHEFGHHARDHLWKQIGWYALFAFVEAYLVALVCRRRGGLARPEAIPLALFVVTVFSLVVQPVQNVIIRHYEAEADWAALQTTHSPIAMAGVFRHFGSADLADPDPPTWSYILFSTHPTLMQRIAMTRAWMARNRTGGS
jgi:STE24 endopeptidase